MKPPVKLTNRVQVKQKAINFFPTNSLAQWTYREYRRQYSPICTWSVAVTFAPQVLHMPSPLGENNRNIHLLYPTKDKNSRILDHLGPSNTIYKKLKKLQIHDASKEMNEPRRL